MTKEDRNSDFIDLLQSIAKQVALRNSASELADFLATTVDDETILEFLCWFFDRLGNKYDKDVISMLVVFCDHFTEHYHKQDAEEYEGHDNFANAFSELMTPDYESIKHELNKTYGSDDSSLWDELDD